MSASLRLADPETESFTFGEAAIVIKAHAMLGQVANPELYYLSKAIDRRPQVDGRALLTFLV